MNSIQSVVGTSAGYVIYFAAFFLAVAFLTVLLWLIKERRDKIRLIVVGLHFLLVFFFLSVLLDYSYDVLLEARPEVLRAFEYRMLAMPWLIAFALELVFAAVFFLHVQFIRKERDTHLTPDAIRQTVDRLPTGLLFSEPDGTVLLANPIMTELCRKLTGELLSDAERFWRYVEKKAPDRLIHTSNGETWQFAKSRITLHDREYNQVTAFDVTEQYCVTEQLSQKNLHLKEMQDRMKALTEKERSLIAEREIMNARMTVHNRMGAVLLSGKYYLDHPEKVKEEEILRLLEFNSHFLISEAEQPESEEYPLQESILTAGRIGVNVEIKGTLPEDETALLIIALGIDQCAANAVRHARGDRLKVMVTEDRSSVKALFSNNGSPPEGPITETGGLAVLRKTVEDAGGSMHIQSEPVFLLTISTPKRS